nr:MAG TPA: hypothetical protein [Caudoviricetes sp.]DAI36787.1 MAG TPA: hypothetical protein [Caudoviricetes sp.]
MFFVTVLIIYTTFSKCYTCVIASNNISLPHLL